jgi:EAL domain-containing protein (putative c-di-GMP-specific phosphodiesterase class I)
VLLRMRDAAGQSVPTPRLITAAENSGRMGVIDRWVLSQTWLDARPPGRLRHTVFVCMNLSGASLNDELCAGGAAACSARRRGARLCLEITESVALHDLENTRRFIDQVRGLGARWR